MLETDNRFVAKLVKKDGTGLNPHKASVMLGGCLWITALGYVPVMVAIKLDCSWISSLRFFVLPAYFCFVNWCFKNDKLK